MIRFVVVVIIVPSIDDASTPRESHVVLVRLVASYLLLDLSLFYDRSSITNTKCLVLVRPIVPDS